MTVEDVTAAIASLTADGWTPTELASLGDREKLGLLLLTVKGPPATYGEAIRKQIIGVILRGATSSKWRLMRLVDSGTDVAGDQVPAGVQRFENFCAVAGMAPWADPERSTVFHRDVVPGSLVQRVQRSGLCYMHGSDVVLHYRVCKSKAVAGDPAPANHEMVDLTAFMLAHLSGEELWKFVENPGDDSVRFLKRLAQTEEVRQLDCDWLLEPATVGQVVQLFDQYGPALVARFRTNATWRNATVSSHIGGDMERGADTGLHAMALVGYRRVEGGNVRFLIQNWWGAKQFFEADLPYLHSRGATLAFIRANLDHIPVDWPISNRLYGENELDAPEREAADEY